MHWIQRHILKELAFSDSKRYRELKPDAVDGNLFQYHAKQIESAGLISRTSDGYALTEAGKSYVAELSQTKIMGRRRLPIPMVMVAARDESGRYLLFRWRRQPYRGLVSLPFGRQTAGQTASEAAEEQLRLKTGYTASLSPIGTVEIITRKTELVDHRLCQVFRANDLVSTENPDGLTGEFFWGDPADITQDEAAPGLRQVIEWLKDDGRSPNLTILD